MILTRPLGDLHHTSGVAGEVVLVLLDHGDLPLGVLLQGQVVHDDTVGDPDLLHDLDSQPHGDPGQGGLVCNVTISGDTTVGQLRLVSENCAGVNLVLLPHDAVAVTG